MFKLFRYLKPYTPHMIAVVVLMLLQSLGQLYLPTLMADIVNYGVVEGNTAYILEIGGFMLLVAAAATGCNIWASYILSKTAARFGTILRSRVFSHVESFSLYEFDTFGTASLITRTTNDITQVQQLLVMMRMFIGAPTMMIGGIIMAVYQDVTLSLVLMIAVPAIAAVIILIARKGVPLFKAVQNKLDRLNLVLREHLTGIRVTRAFNRTEHEQERFQEANRDLTGTSVKVNLIMSSMMPAMMLIFNFAMIAILWFGGIRIDASHMQIGDLMAFIQYAMQIMFSLFMVSMMFVMIPRASVSAARINQVLETKPGITDIAGTRRESARLAEGRIEFRDVTFSYPGAEQPAVSGISFSANPGEVTAIIGGTGSGKSTLLNLLLRFYDAGSGSIAVDGTDIRDMPLASLRGSIGYVPQKAVLFSGTVADNIRFGQEDTPDEEVSNAANTAQARDFIEGMKEGYDSAIAQGGTNLSGGQKQRLSIARALARRPAVYLFDDSFSALDFKTDAKLRAALKDETGNATMLIVAQRVSTIMDADRIVVLDEGRIAGIGTHKELMGSCGVYREIVSSQLSEEEIA